MFLRPVGIRASRSKSRTRWDWHAWQGVETIGGGGADGELKGMSLRKEEGAGGGEELA